MPYAHITGWGMSVPTRIMTNDEIAKMVDTSDQKIRELTGIRQRHIAAESDTATSLGVEASFKALELAGVLPDDIDLIICASSSPDYIFPATACLIQDKIGATKAGAFDLLAACSGFIYGLNLGANAIKSGSAKTVLVVGAEVLSRITNWKDRNTCILFGDGAGAFVLQASDQPGGIQAGVMHSDGSGGEFLSVPASGSAMPASEITLHNNLHYIQMNGKEVFRFATRIMGQAVQEATEKSGWKIDDLALIIPHQANFRIIDAAARALKLPIDKFMVNVDKYGNTSTASIPIAAVEAVEAGRLKKGDKVSLVGFGAGLTWAALDAEWTGPLPTQKRVNMGVYRPLNRLRKLLRRIMRWFLNIFLLNMPK